MRKLQQQVTSIAIILILAFIHSPIHTSAASDRAKVEDFVRRLYTVALSREAESGGLAHWTDRLISKHYTAAQVVNFMLIEAPEFLNKNMSDKQFVEVAYKTFFNRPPESAGETFWLRKLSDGYSKRWVIANMLGAPTNEFQSLCRAAGIVTGKITFLASDLPPVNRIGNSASNIANDGIAASQGSFVYFASSGSDAAIYKMRKDGSDITKVINGTASYLNVAGDWIYYITNQHTPYMDPTASPDINVYNQRSKLYKVRTNGNNRTLLDEGNWFNSLTVADQWMVYVRRIANGDKTHSDQIWRMKIDGSQKQRLTDLKPNQFVESVSIENSMIYYTINVYNPNAHMISSVNRMKLDGTAKVQMETRTNREFSRLVAADNQIFYFDSQNSQRYSGSIIKMNTDGTGKQDITPIYPLIVLFCLAVDGDDLYLKIDGDHSVFKFSQSVRHQYDWVTLKPAVDLKKVFVVNILEDWLYYRDEATHRYYRMKKDSSEVQTLIQ